MAKNTAKKKISKKRTAKATKNQGKTKVARPTVKKKKVARPTVKKKKVVRPTVKKKKIVSKSKTKAAPRKQVVAKKKETTAAARPKAARAKSAASGGKSKRAPRASKGKPAKRRLPLNLASFRERLRESQSELLQAYITTKVDSRSRESDGTEDYIDYAVSSYDREFLLSLTELEQSQLKLVEDALKRLDTDGFGLCIQCELPIPTKRLEVQPWARYCLRCQEIADRGLTGEDDDFPSDDEDARDRPAAEAGVEFDDEESGEDDRLVEGG